MIWYGVTRAFIYRNLQKQNCERKWIHSKGENRNFQWQKPIRYWRNENVASTLYEYNYIYNYIAEIYLPLSQLNDRLHCFMSLPTLLIDTIINMNSIQVYSFSLFFFQPDLNSIQFLFWAFFTGVCIKMWILMIQWIYKDGKQTFTLIAYNKTKTKWNQNQDRYWIHVLNFGRSGIKRLLLSHQKGICSEMCSAFMK